MIKLQRRRSSAHVPKRFQQPKLDVAASALATIYYDAQISGKFAFESKAWKPAKGALKIDTGGKCAYCETSTEVVAHALRALPADGDHQRKLATTHTIVAK